MDKLTLEHLAPYLPYGLEVQYQGITNLKEFSDHKKIEPKRWNVWNEDYMSWVNGAPKEIIGDRVSIIKKIEFYKSHIRLYVGKRHGYLKFVCFSEIKPLLRPLSQLTQEIVHNGERFVPIKRLYQIASNFGVNKGVFERITEDILESRAHITELPYYLVSKLFEWHFDIFALIDKGLALPIEGEAN